MFTSFTISELQDFFRIYFKLQYKLLVKWVCYTGYP